MLFDDAVLATISLIFNQRLLLYLQNKITLASK